MRKSVVVLCALAALFAACHRRTPQRPAQPFDRNAFIATNLQTFLANNDLGEPRMIHIEKKAMHIYVVPLPDGYHLALVQRHPALVGRARASLNEAVEQLKRELFVE